VGARSLSPRRDARDGADALRRFERSRAGRTAEVQRRSMRNGDLFQLPDGVR
jgi:hypothetical protein